MQEVLRGMVRSWRLSVGSGVWEKQQQQQKPGVPGAATQDSGFGIPADDPGSSHLGAPKTRVTGTCRADCLLGPSLCGGTRFHTNKTRGVGGADQAREPER